MEEQEIRRKVQLLYTIKPREDWVVLTRNRFLPVKEDAVGNALQKGGFWGIVKAAGRSFGSYIERPAFVIPAFTLLIVGGVVLQGVSVSLPGDTLYPIRTAAEQVPLHFVVVENRPFHEFDLAQQRLADLGAVAKQNKVKNLPSAIQEFEEKASKASEGFLSIVENQPQNALQASRQMIELQKEKLEIERILGTKIGEEQEKEIQGTLRKLVEYEIGYLETRSLTEEQKTLFEDAKALIGEENYEKALETIWRISQDE
jgi:hypothetical protein